MKIKGSQVSEGLKKSLHADQNIKKPEYHKPEKGHTEAIKRI